jgi:monofunctional biosynthetic peptidoglycan transglycosylase
MLSSFLRHFTRGLLWFAAASIAVVLVLRWVPPPGTALMVERKVESWFSGEPIDLQRDWTPWEEISDELKVAVIAGEDQKFASHWGFDIPAIQAALAYNERGGKVRGASTLTQQVAKNMFLWSGRSWLRKGLEAWFTALIELFWSKERILEVYLNSAEWGKGVFGAQAAARYHFGVDASRLTRQQAALLAAVLPSPIKWSASRRAPMWPAARVDSPADEPVGWASYLMQLDASRRLKLRPRASRNLWEWLCHEKGNAFAGVRG